MTWRCELGALGAGRHARWCGCACTARAPVTGDIIAIAEAADDGYHANNYAGVQLRIDHLVDLRW